MTTDTKRHIKPRLHPRPELDSRSTWRYAVAGLSASLVGLGLARFSYTPLVPALIAAKWFGASDVVYLGAANLVGYLAGALAARALATRIGAVRALRAMMLLATLSFFASATPLSFTWFFAWRFLSGLTGGIIMVLTASVILPHTSAGRRGIVGGVIVAGVGLGVAASGTLVPLLLQQGLSQSWYGLGLLSALLTLASWWNWPVEAKPVATPLHEAKHHRGSLAARALLLQYGLNAVSLVPHMVFIVDFVARALGQGIAAASRYWVLRPGRSRRATRHRPPGRPVWIRSCFARGVPGRDRGRADAHCQHGAGVTDRLKRGGRCLHARDRAPGPWTGARIGAALA